MNTHTKELEWIHNGIQCVIFAISFGHRCGYVKVPVGNKYHNKSYNEIEDIEIHGGLTYSEPYLVEEPVKEDDWWIGFDCAHLNDIKDPSIMSEEFVGIFIDILNLVDVMFSPEIKESKMWTLEMVKAETERLADQIKEVK